MITLILATIFLIMGIYTPVLSSEGGGINAIKFVLLIISLALFLFHFL